MKQQEYRLGYRADLEGLRGVAILLVVAVHAGVPWLPGGFVGVDVFFVLSGFLITGLLVREVTTTGTLKFAAFYVRRLRRLLPALFLMLVVACGCAVLLLAPAEQLSQAPVATAAAVWGSNIYLAVRHLGYFASGTNWFLHTWSLGVEEQFYLVWPALLVWLLGRGGAPSPAQGWHVAGGGREPGRMRRTDLPITATWLLPDANAGVAVCRWRARLAVLHGAGRAGPGAPGAMAHVGWLGRVGADRGCQPVAEW